MPVVVMVVFLMAVTDVLVVVVMLTVAVLVMGRVLFMARTGVLMFAVMMVFVLVDFQMIMTVFRMLPDTGFILRMGMLFFHDTTVWSWQR